MAQQSDPLELVVKAAADPDHDPLVVSGTIQLVDETGIPVDYISGTLLQQTMERIYQRAYGPINQERVRLAEAIEDWTLSSALVDRLTELVVEPLMDGFCGEDAPLVHLSSVVLRMGIVDMPQELWWTPVVIEKLFAGNPDRPRRKGRPSLGKTVSYANLNSYLFVASSIARRDLPLQREGGDGLDLYAEHSATLGTVVRSLLMAMVD